ncbi:inner membrane protein [Klebsiella pneumoniae]|nr:inner membrane protein [Klebsiella pneumoniae]
MVSALYAVLGALLLVKFSFDVVRLRTQYHVGYGDGALASCRLPSAFTAMPSNMCRLASFCCYLWR